MQSKANNVTDNEFGPQVKAAFADVVKNITRVNNVLEDLIKNYEKLKKIYESEELVEKDQSSDTEIDEQFKNAEKKINRSKPKTSTTDPDRIATQMFLSAEHKKIWSEENEVEIDNSQEKARDPHFEYLKEGKVESSGSGSQNDSYTDETYSSDEESRESETDGVNSLIIYRNTNAKPPKRRRVKPKKLSNNKNENDVRSNKIIQLSYKNETLPLFKLELTEVFTKLGKDNSEKNGGRKESGDVVLNQNNLLRTKNESTKKTDNYVKVCVLNNTSQIYLNNKCEWHPLKIYYIK